MMTQVKPQWDVIAIRYAQNTLSPAHALLDPDPHETDCALDYYVWLCVSGERKILVDTGFGPEEGEKRGRKINLHPVEALLRLGHPPDSITDIFLTHLHYDHAGNLNAFPNARIHVQDREVAFATGRCMCHARMRKPFAVQDVTQLIELVYKDRVIFHEGDFDLAPGLRGLLVGGHSQGLQMLKVDGEHPLILASDAMHLRRYLSDEQVFPAFANYFETVEGYRLLREYAATGVEIVPGHDPDVLTLYPRVFPEWADAVWLRKRP